MKVHGRDRRSFVGALAYLALTCCTAVSLAGGGPENVLLLIDPTSGDSKYIGNYYRQARNIPDRNVIYMPAVPSGMSYSTFVDAHLPVFLGMIKQRLLSDHIDYVVVPPGGTYRMSAPGLVDDSCFPVSNFSAGSIYTMAYLAEDILDGAESVATNHYYATDATAKAFDSETTWLFGEPSSSASARSYYIGAMLGYTGFRGNTLAEILAMIDRSVAVDGTRPAGTFYYMETADTLRSDPRDGEFAEAIAALLALGASAVEVQNWLPYGENDCLGLMSGFATVDIDGADMTILDGAFGDHLTSFAGYFDEGSQTKMSEWIRKGASGTCGTVEEPCNYPGKFPHPNMHVYYYEGLSLGEANLRSLQYVPYQVLLYGDPLTRPFAYLPVVEVADAPAGPVSGTIALTPTATTDNPNAGIGRFELLVDGILAGTALVGESFSLDTAALADGVHDLRVIAFEDSDIATQGRWTGTMETDNHGLSVSAQGTPAAGDLDTVFTVSVDVEDPADLLEIRLRQHGRVIAATSEAADDFVIIGSNLGGGINRLIAEAEYTDGRLVQSAPVEVEIANFTIGLNGPRGANPAVAYDYHYDLLFNEPALIDLPGTNPDAADMTFTLLSQPVLSTVTQIAGSSWKIDPDPLAQGEDTLTFQVNAETNASNIGTITIRYKACLPPAISVQPTDQVACLGGTAVFNVSSPDAETYQWYFNDQPILGAIESVLTIAPVDFDDVGDYRVEAVSTCGTPISSDTVALTAEGNFPIITIQPLDATTTIGGTVVFVSAATGYLPPTFVWQKNGVDIPGATATFLLLTGVDCDDVGTYRMLATNQCGTAYSQEADLTVTGCAATPFLVSASSSVDHGELGPIELDLPPAEVVTEPRIGGSGRLVVSFDQAMDEAVAEDETNISINGVIHGSIASTAMQATLTGGSVLTLEFPGLEGGVLPNGDLYTIELGNLESATGQPLGGDTDFQFRVLVADSNDDQTVDPLDAGAVSARFGQDVFEQFLFDVNADGVIDPLDVGAVLARFGSTAP